MKDLVMHKLVVGPVCTNCYFLLNIDTKEVIIVDPGEQPLDIDLMVKKLQAKPVAILLTHGHYDHVTAALEVKQLYHIPIYAARAEEKLLKSPSLNLSAYGSRQVSIEPDVFLEDRETFTMAGFSIEMILTPGHTEGSCCYYIADEEVLLSGDMLFYGSVGRTDLPTGSSSSIRKSLHMLLELLPEETNVCPGHDMTTTIGYEKRYNPFV